MPGLLPEELVSLPSRLSLQSRTGPPAPSAGRPDVTQAWVGPAGHPQPLSLWPSSFRGHQHSALVPRGASHTRTPWTGSWSRGVFPGGSASLLLTPVHGAGPPRPLPCASLSLALRFAQQPGRRLRIAGGASCLLPGARSWPRGRAVHGSEVPPRPRLLPPPARPPAPCALSMHLPLPAPLALLGGRLPLARAHPGIPRAPRLASPLLPAHTRWHRTWEHVALQLVRPTVRRKSQSSRASR